MNIPNDLKYTADHEWIRLDGDTATVGITAFAAEALGDIVYVELPDSGTSLSAGNPCGEIESTKSVSDLVAPAAGEVLESNEQVVAEPSLVNSDPYGEGWLIKICVTGELELLDAQAYTSLTVSGS